MSKFTEEHVRLLGVLSDYELARGVPVHDLAQRLIRLAREAGQWLERNP